MRRRRGRGGGGWWRERGVHAAATSAGHEGLGPPQHSLYLAPLRTLVLTADRRLGERGIDSSQKPTILQNQELTHL